MSILRVCPVRGAPWLISLVCLIAAATIAGCADQSSDATGPTASPAAQASADDLLPVDCLLPGQIRQLGQFSTYLSRGRSIKTSAVDCRVRGGEYVAYDRADYATALKVWLPKAQDGDPEAQTYVGQIYQKGMGLAPDYAVAAAWYQRAADQRYSPAQIDLGLLYEQGLGVPKDPQKALDLYRSASGLGASELQLASLSGNTSQIAGLQEALDRETGESQRLRERVGQLEGDLARSRDDLAHRQAQADQERQGLGAAQGELSRQQTALQSEQRKLDAQSDQLRRLERERDQLAADRDRLTRELQAPQAQPAPAPAPSAAELARLQAVQEKAALAQAETERARAALAQEQAQLERSRTELAARQAELQKKSQDSARLEAEIASLKQEGESRRREIASLKQEAEGRKAELAQLETQAKQAGTEARLRKKPDETDVAALGPPREPPRPSGEQLVPGVDFGMYYALVIGNDNYQYLPKLETAVRDAQAVSRLLSARYGFQVTTLVNANRYQILSELNKMRERLTEKDNFVIYYAGHGELDRINQRGHWLPVDAEPQSTANWIPNVAITDILNASNAQHVLVLADSCYSGSLTRSALSRLQAGLSAEARANWIRAMIKERSRTALTSGGVKPVLDSIGGQHSVFAQAVLDALADETAVIDGQRLAQEVSAKVRQKARNVGVDQVPEYAPIQYAGHGGGEFFFVVKNNASPASG